MGIYRGIGGTGDSTSDATLEAVTQKAVEADASAAAAAISETNAAASALASQAYAGNAATSATAAAASAVSANSDSDAAEAARLAAVAAKIAAETAETNAETAATSASSSATSATSSASSASTSASSASTSATSAATSASSASTSATTATTKASEATTSATNAASSATSAATSASTATAAKDAALAALDSFDDRYLGAKASDPSVDNDGNALVPGALYYNTTDNVMKVYEGSVWVAAYASISGALLVANNLSDVANASTSRTNLGLGTVATQNANAVAITGGNIDGAPLGATTPAAGTFTTLTATGQTSLGGAAGSESLRVLVRGSSDRWLEVDGGTSGTGGVYGTASLGSLYLSTSGGSAVRFFTNGKATTEQFRVANTASAVNYVQITGSATLTGGPTVSAQGSDFNIPLRLSSKGISAVELGNPSGWAGFTVTTTNNPNRIALNAPATGFIPTFSTAGVDTNAGMAFISKGTGAIDLAAGSSGVNISNGGTVTAITVTASGNLYTSIPLCAITAPTTAGGVQATATPVMFSGTSTTVASGGTGYTVGDVLTVVGGTYTTQATFSVASVSAGVVTAVTRVGGAGYSVLPSNPVTTTGGTGSGATLNAVWTVGPLTITNAGSGYVEQPTVSFSGGGGSGAAAYATVGSGTTVRSLGAPLSFYTPGGEQFRVADTTSAGTSVNFVQTSGNITGASPRFIAVGADTNVGIVFSSKGTSDLSFRTNGTNQEQLRVSHTASAVNYVQVTGAATGSGPTLSVAGSDTNVGLAIRTKGSGFITFGQDSTNQFEIIRTASAVNRLRVTGSVAGSAPIMYAEGSDTNIDLTLTPKGTGAVVVSTSLSTPNTFGFKNRIINGAMMIDQRNAGASVTPSSGSSYTLDRWKNYNSQASKFSFQQNAGSVTPPDGFRNYLGATSLSAYSVGSTDEFDLYQLIEGYNMADLGWGTANAKAVTLSFWVRSSLTGTFGGTVANSGNTRNYPFSYTISAANTWEQKTVTIAGDTTGTWLTTNGVGISLLFSLGAGSTLLGAAGAWTGTATTGATGQVNVVGTSGATFYITGVQLEKGSTATSFDYRPYGTELALCQRYYQKATSTNGAIFRGQGTLTGNLYYWMPFAVVMRASPTMSIGTPIYSNASGASWNNIGQDGAEITATISLSGGYAFIPWTASSEL